MDDYGDTRVVEALPVHVSPQRLKSCVYCGGMLYIKNNELQGVCESCQHDKYVVGNLCYSCAINEPHTCAKCFHQFSELAGDTCANCQLSEVETTTKTQQCSACGQKAFVSEENKLCKECLANRMGFHYCKHCNNASEDDHCSYCKKLCIQCNDKTAVDKGSVYCPTHSPHCGGCGSPITGNKTDVSFCEECRYRQRHGICPTCSYDSRIITSTGVCETCMHEVHGYDEVSHGVESYAVCRECKLNTVEFKGLMCPSCREGKKSCKMCGRAHNKEEIICKSCYKEYE